MQKSLKYGTATVLLVVAATMPAYAHKVHAVKGGYTADSLLDSALSESAYGTQPVVTESERTLDEMLDEIAQSVTTAISLAEGASLAVAGAALIRHRKASPSYGSGADDSNASRESDSDGTGTL